ncbi:MAG TPA: Uma2 family endonuclease [Planctomycetaceae bacterium]|jgi:Uma2 family endonuclease|nr:Uma2 family endonuclease [Planctomycetaceae bacterium]
MATVLEHTFEARSPPTVADLSVKFGPIPAWRIRTDPPPGTATEEDVLRVEISEKRLCELVDGILVEKAAGYDESVLAVWVGTLLSNFVRPRRLGFVAGEAGMLRLAPNLIRIPDVSFVSRERVPGGRRPKGPIAQIVPNLAVEILSESNTRKEMQRKLREYFKAGIELVWYVDPRSRTVEVFTSPAKSAVLKESQTLTGGRVLPGFKVKVRELFEE